MQKYDSNLIDIVGAAQSTKRHYVKLQKKMENDPEFVFTLPTLACMISKVKKDKDTESWLYQDQMLKHFNQAKGYTQSHAVEIINKIIACFDECFLSVHKENDIRDVSVTAEGDKIIFNVCQILNCFVWPTLQIEYDEETVLSKQLQALKSLYVNNRGKRSKTMNEIKPLKNLSKNL